MAGPEAQTNNVDIAMSKLRELQSMIYDHNISNKKLFTKTEELMQYMNMASKEIRMNYETISKKLTEQMNTGRIQ